MKIDKILHDTLDEAQASYNDGTERLQLMRERIEKLEEEYSQTYAEVNKEWCDKLLESLKDKLLCHDEGRRVRYYTDIHVDGKSDRTLAKELSITNSSISYSASRPFASLCNTPKSTADKLSSIGYETRSTMDDYIETMGEMKEAINKILGSTVLQVILRESDKGTTLYLMSWKGEKAEGIRLYTSLGKDDYKEITVGHSIDPYHTRGTCLDGWDKGGNKRLYKGKASSMIKKLLEALENEISNGFGLYVNAKN